MFCWKCGNENPEGSAFCVYCGSSLNDDPSKMHADIPETSALDAGSAPSQPQSAAQDAGTDEEGTTILGTDEDYTFSPGSGNGGSSYAGQNAGGTSYSAQGGYSNDHSYSAQGGYSGGLQRDSYPDDGRKKKTPWIFIVLIAIIAAAVIVIVVAMVKGRGSSTQEDTTVVETTEDTAESTDESAAESTAESTAESADETSSDSGLPALTEVTSTYVLYGKNTDLSGLTISALIPASAENGDEDLLTVTITNAGETAYSLGDSSSGTYYVAMITTRGKRYEATGENTTIPAGSSIFLQYDLSQVDGEFDCIVIAKVYAGESFEGDGSYVSVSFDRIKQSEIE